jgi:hypothetical protein
MNVFSGISCRDCGRHTLHLEWRLEGTAMLRQGQGPMVVEWPYCVCEGCGAVSRAQPPEGGGPAVLEMNPQSIYDGPFRCDNE